MKAEPTEIQKSEARKQIQYEYSQLTGDPHINSQGEPDIDYVEYLENLVVDRHNYARIQIEKHLDIVKTKFNSNPLQTLEYVLDSTPINLD